MGWSYPRVLTSLCRIRSHINEKLCQHKKFGIYIWFGDHSIALKVILDFSQFLYSNEYMNMYPYIQVYLYRIIQMSMYCLFLTFLILIFNLNYDNKVMTKVVAKPNRYLTKSCSAISSPLWLYSDFWMVLDKCVWV